MNKSKRANYMGSSAAILFAISAASCTNPQAAENSGNGAIDFASMCTPEGVTSVISGLPGGITVAQVPNGPQLSGGTKLVAATEKVPAYCQVTGSYVTNPATGKTANYIATFPERWNGKYLQLGCSGSCGFLLMNDPATPPITVTAQGYPGQLIEKGYATFGNDLGHVAKSPVSMESDWMTNPDGSLNDDAMEDYLVRADQVMADMGKGYARAFYSQMTGSDAEISKSYFSGCSQGGREALIAATRFPEKFDGIIAGSPALDIPGVMFHSVGRGIYAEGHPPEELTSGQIELLKSIVTERCDEADGVKDGLIQNPAACNIVPTRDIRVCAAGETGEACVSKAQSDILNLYFSGIADAEGNLVHPGMPISDQTYAFVAPVPDGIPVDEALRIVIGAEFDGRALVSTEKSAGSAGPFHLVVNDPAYDKYKEVMGSGVPRPEDFSNLLKSDRKLLWYHNLSDEALTPYMSIRNYQRIADLNGGYDTLQENIRFFTIPGSGHCGMGGPGPSNFDAIGSLEAWVEEGTAPNAIPARLLDPKRDNILFGMVDWSKPAPRTMPLCTYPQMASYKGVGDVNDGANWECNEGDSRMLENGETGAVANLE